MAAYRIVFEDGSDEEVHADGFSRTGDVLEFTVSQAGGSTSSTHVVRAVPCGSIARVDWLTDEGAAVPLDLPGPNGSRASGSARRRRGSSPR